MWGWYLLRPVWTTTTTITIRCVVYLKFVMSLLLLHDDREMGIYDGFFICDIFDSECNKWIICERDKTVCKMCVMNVCCCVISCQCTPVCNNTVCISAFFRDFFAGKVKIFCCNLVLLSYYIVWRNTRSICERVFCEGFLVDFSNAIKVVLTQTMHILKKCCCGRGQMSATLKKPTLSVALLLI